MLSQVTFLRKTHGSRLNVFAPINDLSALSKSGTEIQTMNIPLYQDIEVTGERILGDEYSDHVVKVRTVPFFVDP